MSYSTINLFCLLLAVVVLVSCDSGEKDNNKFQANNFTVPRDGKLSEKQLLNYIAIRQRINNQLKKREKIMLENFVTDSNATKRDTLYFDEIEKLVAEQMETSYAEYIWIKDTVITTRTSMWLKRYFEVNNKIASLLNQTLDRYNETSGSSLDKLEKQKMDNYVKEMKNELTNLQQKLELTEHEIEALSHNSAIIEKYQSEIESLDK